MEKRKHPRIKINNLSIDVSDGSNVCRGTVGDISLFGIRINEIPEKLNVKAPIMKVVLSEKNKLFKMDVTPRWHIEEGDKTSMGVKILNTSWSWTDHIIKHDIMSILN
jgi:hypothetical protein